MWPHDCQKEQEYLRFPIYSQDYGLYRKIQIDLSMERYWPCTAYGQFSQAIKTVDAEYFELCEAKSILKFYRRRKKRTFWRRFDRENICLSCVWTYLRACLMRCGVI